MPPWQLTIRMVVLNLTSMKRLVVISDQVTQLRDDIELGEKTSIHIMCKS